MIQFLFFYSLKCCSARQVLIKSFHEIIFPSRILCTGNIESSSEMKWNLSLKENFVDFVAFVLQNVYISYQFTRCRMCDKSSVLLRKSEESCETATREIKNGTVAVI